MNYTYDEKTGAGTTYSYKYEFAGYTSTQAGNNSVFKVTVTNQDSFSKNVSIKSETCPYAATTTNLSVKTGITTLDTCDGTVAVDIYVFNEYMTIYVGQKDNGADNLAVYKVETTDMVMTLDSYTLTKGTGYAPTHLFNSIKWNYTKDDGYTNYDVTILGETKDYLFIHINETAAYLYVSNDSDYKPLYAKDGGDQPVLYPVNRVTLPTYVYDLGYVDGTAKTLTVFYYDTEKAPLVVLKIDLGKDPLLRLDETTNYS